MQHCMLHAALHGIACNGKWCWYMLHDTARCMLHAPLHTAFICCVTLHAACSCMLHCMLHARTAHCAHLQQKTWSQNDKKSAFVYHINAHVDGCKIINSGERQKRVSLAKRKKKDVCTIGECKMQNIFKNVSIRLSVLQTKKNASSSRDESGSRHP